MRISSLAPDIKKQASIILLFILVFVLSSVSSGKYSGGFGTVEEPYLISTPNDLNSIGLDPNDWDKHFKMIADINMASYTGEQFNVIGSEMKPFTGVFNGNTNTIFNFRYQCTGQQYIGLFGYIASSSATVMNLNMVNSSLDMSSNYSGLVAGYLEEGTIYNCKVIDGNTITPQRTGLLVGLNNGNVIGCDVNGVITSYSECGGLVGWNTGIINDCNASVTVISEYDVYSGIGGLVGVNRSGGIANNCTCSARVLGGNCVGGLVGYNHEGTITDCSVVGSVVGENEYVGGLVGLSSDGDISYCRASCDVNCSNANVDFIGGLVGRVFPGLVSNCSSSGTVSASDWNSHHLGGLVGEGIDAVIINCTSDANVSGTGDCIGGLIGSSDSSEIMNCYSAGTVKGSDYVGGAVGRLYSMSLIGESHAVGNVSGQYSVGGLIGYIKGNNELNNCYATGDVNGVEEVGGLVGHSQIYLGGTYPYHCYSTGLVPTSGNYVGGLIGRGPNYSDDTSFWDTQTSGTSSSADGTGLPTDQMQQRGTFADAGWDMVNVWDIGENQTYPFLRTRLPSDINKDDETNFYDFAILAEHWLSQ